MRNNKGSQAQAAAPTLERLAGIFSDRPFQPFWKKEIGGQKVNFYTLAETFGYTAEQVKAIRNGHGWIVAHLPERGERRAAAAVDSAKLASFVSRSCK